jgi:NTP pyrophosphatase (non-canonical NTP hydrolase)
MSDEHTVTGKIRPMESDAKAVHDFGVEMLKKLFKNRRKAHWSTVSHQYLFDRLLEEIEELRDAMTGTEGDIVSECADVANFAMMIADNLKNGRG